MLLKNLLPASALLSLASIIQPVASASSPDSKEFYLFSISGTQNSDVQYVQVQVRSNQLIIPTGANAISANNNSDSNSDKSNFIGKIWKNGYLHQESSSDSNNDDSYVVVVDKNSKQLTLKNSAKQPGAGPFSISSNALKLEKSQSFVACKEKNDDYFGIYTNGYSCTDGKKYSINLRTNLVGSIDTLESFEPSETKSSQFNAASYTTSSSSTAHSSTHSSSSSPSSSSSLASSSSSSSSSTISKSSSSSSSSSKKTISSSSNSSEEPSSFSSTHTQSSTASSASENTAAENTSTLTLSPTSTSVATSASSSGKEAASSIYQSTLFSISVDSSDHETSSVAVATTFFAGASAPRVPMIAVAQHGSGLGLLSSVCVGIFGSLLVLLLA